MNLFEPFLNKDYEATKSLDFEYIMFQHLLYFGKVKIQYRVPSNGSGHGGKIDFVLFTETKKIGIEIDRKSPRKKSLFKLKNLEADECYMVLRSPFSFYKIK